MEGEAGRPRSAGEQDHQCMKVVKMRNNQCVVRNNLTALFILVVAGYPEQPKHPFDGSQAQVKVPASVFQPHKVTILSNNRVITNVLFQCDNLCVR